MVDKVVSSDWAWLPSHILDLVVDSLVDFPDFIRFGSVCKPWRSIAHHQSHSPQLFLLQLLKTCRNQLPMLLTSSSTDNSQRSLYSITEKSNYQIQMPINCDTRFCGSSQGWLFMIDKPMKITLVNPFLNKTIVLPDFPPEEYKFQQPQDFENQNVEFDDHDYFIIKAILLPQTSPSQGENNFDVLMIYGDERKLAFLKSREVRWTTGAVKAPDFSIGLSDIISYKGKVYAVSFSSSLLCIDVTTGACQTLINTNAFAQITYLVESQEGDLLQIRRFVDDDYDTGMHRTTNFEVFRLSWGEQEDGNPSWVKVDRIGDQALFLGTSYSMSISTRDFPECKSNCIYYEDHFDFYIQRNDDDTGIFNMEDKSFSRHYIQDPSFSPTLPPIWIVPQLKLKTTASSLDCANNDP